MSKNFEIISKKCKKYCPKQDFLDGKLFYDGETPKTVTDFKVGDRVTVTSACGTRRVTFTLLHEHLK